MGIHGSITFYLPPGVKTLKIKNPPRPVPASSPIKKKAHEEKQAQHSEEGEPSTPASSYPFPDCENYRSLGGCVRVLHQRYSGNRGNIMRCKTCGRTFSERRGDISFKSRIPAEILAELVRCHERGESIRKAARTLDLNRGTVRRYYRLLDRREELS